MNSNITINQSSGTAVHADMFLGNNVESGQDLPTYWNFTNTDVLVLCLMQLTTNVGTTTPVWWNLQIYED